MFCNSRRSFYESDAILIDQDAVLINQEARRQLLIEAFSQILKDDWTSRRRKYSTETRGSFCAPGKLYLYIPVILPVSKTWFFLSGCNNVLLKFSFRLKWFLTSILGRLRNFRAFQTNLSILIRNSWAWKLLHLISGQNYFILLSRARSIIYGIRCTLC